MSCDCNVEIWSCVSLSRCCADALSSCSLRLALSKRALSLSLSLSGGLHARIVQGKPTFLVEHALFGLLPDWCFKCSGLVRNLGLVSSSLLCHINRVQPDMKLNILLKVTRLMQMKLPTILSNVVLNTTMLTRVHLTGAAEGLERWRAGRIAGR